MKSSSSTISSSSIRSRHESVGLMEDVVPLGRRDEFSSSLSTLGIDDDEDEGDQEGRGGPTPQELAERAAAKKAGQERHRRFMSNMVDKFPEDFKKPGKMVACMICSLIKPLDEFEEEGCDNCERILRVAGQRGSASAYTSENYEGLVGLLDTKGSWVGRYLRFRGKKAGLYAVNVKGIVSPSIRQDLADAEVDYRSQDRSVPRGRERQRQDELEAEEDEIAKQRATRKIRRHRRRTRRAEKKAAKDKKEKAGGQGEQSGNEDVDADGADNEDDGFEQPPESPAVPSLSIIHGRVEGVGAEMLESGEGEEIPDV